MVFYFIHFFLMELQGDTGSKLIIFADAIPEPIGVKLSSLMLTL